MKLDRTFWNTVWTVLVVVITWSPPRRSNRLAQTYSVSMVNLQCSNQPSAGLVLGR
jgi:hypothetical protein